MKCCKALAGQHGLWHLVEWDWLTPFQAVSEAQLCVICHLGAQTLICRRQAIVLYAVHLYALLFGGDSALEGQLLG